VRLQPGSSKHRRFSGYLPLSSHHTRASLEDSDLLRTPWQQLATFRRRCCAQVNIFTINAALLLLPPPQNGADIRARAWGTFFRQGGPMYYGEYALSFAACTGQKDVVAYLRRHGAQVGLGSCWFTVLCSLGQSCRWRVQCTCLRKRC
jgi:hypothetical protein